MKNFNKNLSWLYPKHYLTEYAYLANVEFSIPKTGIIFIFAK